MRQIPMLFSGAMIEALLAGRKTETRRTLKPQPFDHLQVSKFSRVIGDRKTGVWSWQACDLNDKPVFAFNQGAHFITECVNGRCFTGDLIWVREAHYLTDDGESEFAVCAADKDAVDEHLQNMQSTMASHPSIDWSKHLRLRPSIHMPKWASRLTLRVTSYGIERLHDIDEAGAIAEGIEKLKSGRGFYDPTMSKGVVHVGHYLPTARSAYAALWNSINGDGAWDENPWVDVTKFEVIRQNVAEVAA